MHRACEEIVLQRVVLRDLSIRSYEAEWFKLKFMSELLLHLISKR